MLARPCLERRIPDQETLQAEVAAWSEARNREAARIDWSFRVEEARTALPHLYPVPDDAI